MNFKNIEKKAASQAIHKTLQMIEDEFEIELDKEDKYPPRKRRKITIELLKDKLEQNEDTIDEISEEIDEFTEKTILKWYKVGVRRGAIEMLRALIDEDVINDIEYDDFVKDFEKLIWQCSLNYTKFDDSKAKIKRKEYSVPFKKILKRLEK